jgi:hypothetical protein
MDTTRLKHFIKAFWEDSILRSLARAIVEPRSTPQPSRELGMSEPDERSELVAEKLISRTAS